MLPVPVLLVARLLRERPRWSSPARAGRSDETGLPIFAYVRPIVIPGFRCRRLISLGCVLRLVLSHSFVLASSYCLHPAVPQRERVSIIPLSSSSVEEDPFVDDLIEVGRSPPPKRAKLTDGALLDGGQSPGVRPRAVPLMVEARRFALVLAGAMLDPSPSLE
jgi:hypothetical protein